jgi:CubicO group peptidase (beta-lactamase class C family)
MDDRRFLTGRTDGRGSAASSDAASVPWWSFTKTALATAALQLVARGQLMLDDPVDGRRYTLRQLLQHRAGVPDYGHLTIYHEAVRRGDPLWDASQLFARVAVDHLDFEPGQGWQYSNLGYFLVRRMIETATGEDLGSALRHLIFDSLGLASVRLATCVILMQPNGEMPTGMIRDGSFTDCWWERPVMRFASSTGSCWAKCCREHS